jgi:UTP--glucose-1-phosphate uridylyltransferase
VGRNSFAWSEVRDEVQPVLEPLGLKLDEARIERFSDAIRSRSLRPGSNRLERPPEPAGRDDVDVLGSFSANERARFTARGHAALEAGEVAAAVLNGGMATRFGGVVKGILEALGGLSFLEIKLRQARAVGPAPFLVMNSFATHQPTLDFLRARGLEAHVRTFLQDVSLRLAPDGSLFRDREGALSLYAPGHGDFPSALRAAGLIDELRDAGVRTVQLSNVDNLGAELDPAVLGYHLDHGRRITAEVAEAVPDDVGGAPAFIDGRLQIVEGFRFPESFDHRQNRFLATNTFWFSVEALAEARELRWFYVTKEVDGRPAVQMERLVNELTASFPTAYLATPRGGDDGRFFPVKTREDLEALRADAALVRRFTHAA